MDEAKKGELAALIFFGAVALIFLFSYIAGRINEDRHYSNPSDFKFKIYRKSRWVPPECKCKNCLHNGHREYWWEMQGWYTSGKGKNRIRRQAYDPYWRYDSWDEAMMYAAYYAKNPKDSFWRGY